MPLGENGWRWAFAIGALPALYAIVVTVGTARVRSLLLKKGRVEEAADVVESLEESAGPEWRKARATDGVDEIARGVQLCWSTTLRSRK